MTLKEAKGIIKDAIQEQKNQELPHQPGHCAFIDGIEYALELIEKEKIDANK